MLCPSTTHQWLSHFSLALIDLRPGLALPVAVTRAVSAHAHLSDLSPTEAAAIEASVMAGQAARRLARARSHAAQPRDA